MVVPCETVIFSIGFFLLLLLVRFTEQMSPFPGAWLFSYFSLSLSDVCNSTDLPEVEIISLLEEQLPHYKLRADTIYGYDHDDWLHTPLISPDVNLDLTTEQIEETLKYFRKHRITLSSGSSIFLSHIHCFSCLVLCHPWWSYLFSLTLFYSK